MGFEGEPSTAKSSHLYRPSDFAFLDDWEDRYRYVLELGRTLEPLSEAAHNGANKVRGCVSQVWLELGDGANATGERVLHYRGDSDSHLVRGLIAIALALYSDRTVREILSSDAQAFFRELGLEQHLTPQLSINLPSRRRRPACDYALRRLCRSNYCLTQTQNFSRNLSTLL